MHIARYCSAYVRPFATVSTGVPVPGFAPVIPPRITGKAIRRMTMIRPAMQTAVKFYRYPTPICLVSSRAMKASGMGLNAAMM